MADRPEIKVSELGELYYDKQEPVENLVTWVYEEGSFVPCAKIENGKTYSIISDYIGRPVQAFDEASEVVWETDYDIYGRLRDLQGSKNFIPFRQLGQYEDLELDGLYYNRFRYYSSETGMYISQDPAGLLGGIELYNYVHDTNIWIDPFGLNEINWNNGWRTADGKFASPQGPGVSGQAAVDSVRSDLSNKGWIHLGDELSVRDSSQQLRRYDLVFRKPDGTVVGVEVKSNSARRTKAQRTFDNRVSKATPAKGVGKFSGQEIEEVLVKNVKCP